MTPQITIFTCSYNKPQYVLEAINSVLAQTYTNFEYIILENSDDNLTRGLVHKIKDGRVQIIDADFDKKFRDKNYIESHLKNEYFPIARGNFITTLSDDDLLKPHCFEKHIDDFNEHKSRLANYHGYNIIYINSDIKEEVKPAIKDFGRHRTPRMRLDGGAMMFKADLLDKIDKPFFKCNWYDAHISDGLFLNKIARATTIYPINHILHTKRITPRSTHTYIDEEGKTRFFRPRRGWEHPYLKIDS